MDLMMKRLPFLFLVVAVSYVSVVVSATGVFRVHHKFAGKERSLSDFKAHDERRHGRILGAVDIPLGGNGLPSDAGCVALCICINFLIFSFLSSLSDLGSWVFIGFLDLGLHVDIRFQGKMVSFWV